MLAGLPGETCDEGTRDSVTLGREDPRRFEDMGTPEEADEDPWPDRDHPRRLRTGGGHRRDHGLHWPNEPRRATPTVREASGARRDSERAWLRARVSVGARQGPSAHAASALPPPIRGCYLGGPSPGRGDGRATEHGALKAAGRKQGVWARTSRLGAPRPGRQRASPRSSSRNPEGPTGIFWLGPIQARATEWSCNTPRGFFGSPTRSAPASLPWSHVSMSSASLLSKGVSPSATRSRSWSRLRVNPSGSIAAPTRSTGRDVGVR